MCFTYKQEVPITYNNNAMLFARNSHAVPALPILAGLFLLLSACTTDENYIIDDISDIDPSITLFEDGVTVPVGSTKKINLGTLINDLGEDVNSFIRTGANGDLSLTYDGTVSLNDRIEELNLAGMAKIDGVSFSKDFNYHIGDFNTDLFTFGGTSYELKSTFEGVDIVDISLKDISAIARGLTFQAGLEKYKDLLEANEDLNLARRIGDVLYHEKVMDIQDIKNDAAKFPSENISITKETLPDKDIPYVNVPIKVEPISLHEDVIAIKNVKTSPAAKLWVDLTLINVCFTGGEVIPDVNLDFTGKLHIKGGDNVNIKDMVLNAGNGWKASKVFTVEGLSNKDFGDTFELDDHIPVSGKLYANNMESTKTRINSANGDIYLEIALRFGDFAIQDADIYIKPHSFELQDQVNFGNYSDIALPEEISDVKKVILDETRPLKFKVTPKNFDRIRQKDIDYAFAINFPPAFEVEGAENGKLEFSGKVNDGPIEKEIVVKSLTPTVKNHKISLDSGVTVDGQVTINNLVLSSATLPQNSSEDISFTVDIEGSPAIKDYIIVLNDFEDEAKIGDTLEMDVDGVGDFGSFHVVPVGNPAITINLDIPDIKGLKFKPGNGGVKLNLPDIMVFDAAGIDPSLGFNAAENTITIKDQFPGTITLPIKELFLKPISKGGKSVVETSYSAEGRICIPGTEIYQSELKESFGSSVGLKVDIPKIQARSITLDDKISYDINQKFNLTIQNLPKEIKRIDEILLDDVYVSMDASFDGVPISPTAPISVDLILKMPDFMVPNSIPIKGQVQNGRLSATPVKIEKLHSIDLTNTDKIEGEIVISGTLSAEAASLDLMQLKPDITANFTASLQNSEGKIAVSKVTGVFSYDISESTVMKLEDIPDMLKDDSNSIDVANPRLDLGINTNIGIPMLASIELIPYKKGLPLNDNIIKLNNVKLPFAPDPGKPASKSFSLCKLAAYAAPGAEFIEADLTGLLKQIPDSLKININANVDGNSTSVLEPAAKYTLDVNYGINVPLTFGKDFRFSTQLELDLSGAREITALGDFGIKGKVLNDSPLNLMVEMELLDGTGTVIPQNKSSIINIEGASTSDIEFYLSPADRSREISKARLNIILTAIPNKSLNESDCLQFLNLVAVAPEGITVNFK